MAKLAGINLASGRMSFRIEPSWQSPGRTAQFYDLADSGRLVAPLTALWNSVGVSLLTSASPPTGCARMCTFQRAAVTRRNVAGIEVVSGLGLSFCALKRATSSSASSVVRPLASAASNAFIVGP